MEADGTTLLEEITLDDVETTDDEDEDTVPDIDIISLEVVVLEI